MLIRISLARISLGALTLLAAGLASGQSVFFPHDTTVDPSVHVSLGDGIVGFANFDDYINGANGTSPTVNVAGATFDENLEVDNSSVVNMLSGTVGAFFGRILPVDTSTFNMLGGDTQEANPQENSVFNLFGGHISFMQLNDASRLNMFGGTIDSTLEIDTTGSVVISGGVLGAGNNPAFSSPIAEIDTAATLTMIGKDLSATITDPNFQDFYTVYTLTGHLLDGTDVTGKTVFVENDGGGTFKVQAVPEPCSLLAMGGLLVGLARGRRKPRA